MLHRPLFDLIVHAQAAFAETDQSKKEQDGWIEEDDSHSETGDKPDCCSSHHGNSRDDCTIKEYAGCLLVAAIDVGVALQLCLGGSQMLVRSCRTCGLDWNRPGSRAAKRRGVRRGGDIEVIPKIHVRQ